ncbi:hypothetical protein CRG98_031557 [Punica granatum]|uniref:ABC transporter domain-containing protein n=1 Tax=Punica granatum TaxID=22663 RepID=A0A2I0IWK1_PUNGR|nr:hypothetical protein CRG98_031557 [Punica granatum]
MVNMTYSGRPLRGYQPWRGIGNQSSRWNIGEARKWALQCFRFHGGNGAKKSIVEGVSGMIKPGRMTFLLGLPGCGKTTFLKALVGNLHGHLEMTVMETSDFSARCQGIGLEGQQKGKGGRVCSDPNVDTYMKGVAINGLKKTLQTDYILRLSISLVSIVVLKHVYTLSLDEVQVISRKDQEQYWNRLEVTPSHISVNTFTKNFEESSLGMTLEEELSSPLD